MEILFEIFQLKEPDWTDDFQQALVSIGKAHKTYLNILKLVKLILDVPSVLSNTNTVHWDLQLLTSVMGGICFVDKTT